MCDFQSPAVVVDSSLFLEAVLPFVRGTPLCDLALAYLFALLCTGSPLCQAVCVEVGLLGPASADDLGRDASSSSGMQSRRSPTDRTVASYLCPGRSHDQNDTLMISSRFSHQSDTDFLRIVRAVIASSFTIKIYSLDFIQKPTNLLDSIVRSVNRPTRYHTRSSNTHLPL